MQIKVNLNSFLNKVGLGGGPNLDIVESTEVYSHKEKPEDNWSYFTAFGFKELKNLFQKENLELSKIAIVGIGSGVEGILATKIFDQDLQQLIITDIDKEVIDIATKNITSNLEFRNIRIYSLVGSYCESIEKSKFTVDLVYGNLPNLPSDSDIDLSKGAEKGTFVMSSLYEGYNPPEKFVKYALGSQFAYMQSAKNILAKGGSVVTELGGRVPLELVSELFEDCGFKFEEVISGFKRQTEELIDFEGYSALEKQYGVSFDFYLYEEALEFLNKKEIVNPSNKSGSDLKQLLEPFKINATQALDLYKKQKTAIGHTVHVFRGVKI